VDATDLLLAFLVMTVASAIQGAIGFGGNLIAAPLLVLVDPDLVPGPIILAALILNLLVVRRDRCERPWRELAGANLGQTVGAVGAVALLASLPTDQLAIAFSVIILAAVALSASGLHPDPTPTNRVIGGVASGFMGTTTGIGGPPMALVLQSLDPLRLRALLSRFFLLGGVVSLVLLTWVGRFDRTQAIAGVLLLPGVVAGYSASGWLATHAQREHIRWAVLGLSTASALLALVRALG
jgi:uncharacterized membrane protein YfcA